MASLSDAALRHLQHVVDRPELSGTRYTLIDALGHGGMGAVYRVLDKALSREVAMKVLTGAVDDSARARLENEARVLARLEHPGIVPVHDVGTLPDGRVFYVMKLVRGGALRTLGASVPAVPERLRLIVRIADAVAFAHAHGIVHRDLTPANVMIGPFGEVLVMDWGIALVSQAEADPTGPVVGTPGFMAPEQSHGHADVRSDVYALGGLMAWWLHPDREGPVRLPRTLTSIIATAQAGRPEDRYQSAAAFAADLTRYLDGEAVLAHRESAVERTLRFARRYRVAILLVVGYLLMRIALLVFRGV